MHDQSPLRAETWPMSRTCPFSPPPDYAGLREHPGLPRLTGPSGRTVFVATRHEDVRAVLGDTRFSSDRSHPDFPWIGGTLVRAGEGVAALSAAGNRDPAAFADPDTFDATRDNRRHLAFGSGPHQCLGKSLARLELGIALGTLFRRIPTLRLATPRDELRYVNGSTFSVSALPVTW